MVVKTLEAPLHNCSTSYIVIHYSIEILCINSLYTADIAINKRRSGDKPTSLLLIGSMPQRIREEPGMQT